MRVLREFTVETSHFELGDVINFTLNNEEYVEAFAVKDLGDRMMFLFKNCLDKDYPMNENNTNRGGYEESYLRNKLNSDIINLFPKELLKRMIPFDNGDFLSIPTIANIFGNDKNNDERFFGMKERQNRIVDKCGWYWLQDTVCSTNFTIVNSFGHTSNDNAVLPCGIRPVFILSNI